MSANEAGVHTKVEGLSEFGSIEIVQTSQNEQYPHVKYDEECGIRERIAWNLRWRDEESRIGHVAM